jgi:xanthine dehydrogenase accessory factor
MLASDEDILDTALEWRIAGRGVALATVVETWGSAPRPVGGHLIVDGDGNFFGSVSGGCVEGEVIAEAVDLIALGGRRMLEFGVADETAWRIGLSCGGRIKIYVESLDAKGTDLLAAFNAERAARRSCALVTEIATGERRLVRAEDAAADPMAEIVDKQLRLGKSGMAAWAGKALFLTCATPPTRLVAIGAVHIAQALAPIAKLVGFDMIVVDPRTAFATPERFPDARLLPEWPDAALPPLGLDRHTAMALLSHDPRIDDQGLAQALRSDCFYIGALGSPKTHAKRLERLRAKGSSESELGRIRAPIGLDIGAVTPPEIAVAVLGEIVAALRRASLRAGAEKAA